MTRTKNQNEKKLQLHSRFASNRVSNFPKKNSNLSQYLFFNLNVDLKDSLIETFIDLIKIYHSNVFLCWSCINRHNYLHNKARNEDISMLIGLCCLSVFNIIFDRNYDYYEPKPAKKFGMLVYNEVKLPGQKYFEYSIKREEFLTDIENFVSIAKEEIINNSTRNTAKFIQRTIYNLPVLPMVFLIGTMLVIGLSLSAPLKTLNPRKIVHATLNKGSNILNNLFFNSKGINAVTIAKEMPLFSSLDLDKSYMGYDEGIAYVTGNFDYFDICRFKRELTKRFYGDLQRGIFKSLRLL